jgi:hypothetical protein
MLSVKVLGSELYDNDPGSMVLVPTWPGEWKRVQGPRLLAPAYSVSGTIDELEAFLDRWRDTSPESNVHMHLFRCHVRGVRGKEWDLCLQFALVNWPHTPPGEKLGPLPRIGLVARMTIRDTCRALFEEYVEPCPEA